MPRPQCHHTLVSHPLSPFLSDFIWIWMVTGRARRYRPHQVACVQVTYRILKSMGEVPPKCSIAHVETWRCGLTAIINGSPLEPGVSSVFVTQFACWSWVTS